MMTASIRLWRVLQWQLQVLVHQRAAWVLATLALGLVLGGATLRGFDFGGEESRFVIHFARGAVLLGGTVLLALAGPLLVIGGIEQRATELLLMRGVRRTELVVAQVVALCILVGWLVLTATAVTCGVVPTTDAGGGWSQVWAALAPTLPALGVTAAAAVLMAVIFRSVLLAGAGTLAFALTGHLAPVLERLQNASANWARTAAMLLDVLVPDFAVAMNGASGALYVGVYGVALTLGAALIFSRREF